MKDYGMCHECGQPIREFRWALPDWLCAYCYYSKFGPDEPEEFPKPEDAFTGDYPNGDGSYEFLKEHLYKKPRLYEASFRRIREVLVFFQCFNNLRSMLKFLRTDGRKVRLQVRDDLIKLGKRHIWFRPQAIEMLLFITWKDITARYGKKRFSEGYYALIMQIEAESNHKDTKDTK